MGSGSGTKKRLSLSETAAMSQEEALRVWRELIARDADPLPGDEQLLCRVLITLSLKPEDFAADVAAVAEAAKLNEQIVASEPGADAALQKAAEARDAWVAETARIVAERQAKEDQLESAVNEAMNRVNAVNETRRRLTEIRQAHRRAFGLPQAPQPYDGPQQTVQDHGVVPPPPQHPNASPIMPGEYEVRTGWRN